MVPISCLLIGSFVILQTHGTSVRPGAGCNGDPNAVTGCDTCGTNCDNYDQGPRVCSHRTCLKDECKCRAGFVRNSEGWCIPYEECPGCNGDPNAVTGCDTCGTNCDNYDQGPRGCSYRTCQKDECKCRAGFVRNSEGWCIPYEECPSQPKCPINQEYQCVPPCPLKRCPSKWLMLYRCLPNQKCTNKCDCKDGFLKNGQGTCIPSNQCDKGTKPVRCPANEEYKCVQTCPPKTCQARFAKYKCVANQKCVNKCECKDNYLRNKEGRCVLASQCDGIGQPFCPINQEYKCVKPCPPQICLPRWGVIRYACRPNQNCTNKCDCIEGFLKNGQGTCVPKNQCHKQISQPKCPINQEYKCVLPCPPKICPSKWFRRYACLPNQKCTYRCDCIDGFLKNGQGTCVPSNQCNKKNSADADPADRDSSDPDSADPDSVNSDPENPDAADRDSYDSDPANPDPGNADLVDPNPAEPDTGAPKLGGPDPIPNEPGPDDDSDDCDDEN